MSSRFIHLRTHSEYSMVDGLIRIKPLLKAVAAAGMPAVAITDQSNVFAIVKYYKAAMAVGVKPIIGVDVWLQNEQQPDRPSLLTFLCQNETGYRNMIRLVSRSYIEGQQRGLAIIQRAWLTPETTQGMIALSGARLGDVGQAILAGNIGLAKQLLNYWDNLLPKRYYIELQRTERPHEEDYIRLALDLAQELHLPVVATNDVRFLHNDDFEAHEARVCIHHGHTLEDNRRPRPYSEQQYLKTPEEMRKLFADIPEALENTIEIAKRCNVTLSLGKNYLPNFPIPAGLSIEEYFTQRAQQGLEERLQILLDQNAADHQKQRSKYTERLQTELDVINSMGFQGYFLIVADFIQWSKQSGIPVGPGRGSGPGSLVAYSLKITDLDPLAYDLLFERFLNPERVSMPDFDVDFCMDGRDRVIDYVTERYGRNSVSQIITYGSMAAKAVVRDVGRVLAYPYGFVDKIAKAIPFEIGMTLDKALEQEEELKKRYEQEEDVKTLIDLARKLEGITRNAGKHAGGVVIAPSLLTDFTALYCEEGGGNLVTQFDKDDVEAVGLVKFDFLGLRTLTIIDWAVKGINERRAKNGEALLDISLLPMDDAATFSLMKACATTAVFQLESRGMKDLIKRLQPDCFEDIIALVALFRPGPLQSGMVDDFINRKHGRAKVEYPHPDLEPILRPTYGIIVYQEQVMQIAQVLAGYTLGGADLLRRAMGKKKPEEMAKQRTIFTENAQARGISAEVATYIFDLMEKFAGYGFNKSHSAAYALVSYQTAWLKAHYPAEFMSAVLSSDMDNTDKIVALIDECRSMKLSIIPPHVNHSQYQFTVNAKGEIIYGLGAVKGAGESALSCIINNREEQGKFKDLLDFCTRIDLRKVNRRVIESIIRAGALDGLAPHRASLMANLSAALQAADQLSKLQEQGQHDLFGNLVTTNSVENIPVIEVKPWPMAELLLGEKETLGLYLSGHPLESFENELNKFITAKICNLKPTRDQTVIVAGLIVGLRTMFTKRGDKMAFITIDDRSGRLDLAIFSDLYETYKELLVKDQLVVVEGEVSIDEYTGGFKMSCRKIMELEQAREVHAKHLLMRISEQQASDGLVEQLLTILKPHSEGICPVIIEYSNNHATAQLVLGSKWRVKPCNALMNALQEFLGEQAITINY